MNAIEPNGDLAQRERIHYQWMLSRIQSFKSLVLAIIVAMMGYVANTIGSVDSYSALALLSLSALLLLLGFVLGAIDAGGAIFYNEESQNGLPKCCRWLMCVFILLAAVLIFIAQVCISVERIHTRSIAQASGPAKVPQPVLSATNSTSTPGSHR